MILALNGLPDDLQEIRPELIRENMAFLLYHFEPVLAWLDSDSVYQGFPLRILGFFILRIKLTPARICWLLTRINRCAGK